MRRLEVKWVRECSPEGYAARLPVTGAGQVAVYAGALAAEAVEHLWAVILDARHRVIGHRLISRGSTSATTCDVTEILRAVLLAGGVSFILVHNHPSGDVLPSAQDIESTRRVRAAADVCGLLLLDHVIVGQGVAGQVVHRSVREAGPEVWP